MKGFLQGRGITETMVLLSILIAFVNNVSCLNHKPQSFYWDEIQLQLFVSNEDTVLKGAPVKTIVKEKKDILLPRLYLKTDTIRERFLLTDNIYIFIYVPLGQD